MRVRRLGWVIGAALMSPGASVNADDFVRHDLGGQPLCEASAAVLVPCAQPSGRCVLIGDNEQRRQLFAFPLRRSGRGEPDIDVASRRALAFDTLPASASGDDVEISDIEAMARLTDADFLVVGSHSRNKFCKRRKNRRRLIGLRLVDEQLQMQGDWPYRQSKRATCKRLFGQKAKRLNGQRADVCAALTTAQDAADAAKRSKSKSACEAAQAFNIEGAVAVPVGASAAGSARSARPQVWLGLRAPLVNRKAVLIRLAGAGQSADLTPMFDATALVDLNGWAIRDLTLYQGWTWLLAGPVEDDTAVDFKLWRLPTDSLADGAVIKAQLVGSAPNGAEGLIIDGAAAMVFMDGAEPEKGGVSCRQNATYSVLPLAELKP